MLLDVHWPYSDHSYLPGQLLLSKTQVLAEQILNE